MQNPSTDTDYARKSDTLLIKKVHMPSLAFCIIKSSHLYLYSAFNNTAPHRSTAQYQNRQIVSIM